MGDHALKPAGRVLAGFRRMRRDQPDEPGHECGHGGCDERSAPAEGRGKPWNPEDHESRAQKHRAPVQALREVQRPSREHRRNIPHARDEGGTGPHTNERLPKHQVPVGGGKSNAEIPDAHQCQSCGEHTLGSQIVGQKTAGDLHRSVRQEYGGCEQPRQGKAEVKSLRQRGDQRGVIRVIGREGETDQAGAEEGRSLGC